MSEIKGNSVKNGRGSRSVPNSAWWPQYVSQGPRGSHRRWMGSEVCSWVACPRKLGHVREKSQSHRIPYLFRYNTTQTISGDPQMYFLEIISGQRLRGASVRGNSILSEKNRPAVRTEETIVHTSKLAGQIRSNWILL